MNDSACSVTLVYRQSNTQKKSWMHRFAVSRYTVNFTYYSRTRFENFNGFSKCEVWLKMIGIASCHSSCDRTPGPDRSATPMRQARLGG